MNSNYLFHCGFRFCYVCGMDLDGVNLEHECARAKLCTRERMVDTGLHVAPGDIC